MTKQDWSELNEVFKQHGPALEKLLHWSGQRKGKELVDAKEMLECHRAQGYMHALYDISDRIKHARESE